MLTVALVVVPLTLIVAWLTFQHKPGWYRPVLLDEAGLAHARKEAVATADWVSDRMVQGQAFEVVLTARSLNEATVVRSTLTPN